MNRAWSSQGVEIVSVVAWGELCCNGESGSAFEKREDVKLDGPFPAFERRPSFHKRSGCGSKLKGWVEQS